MGNKNPKKNFNIYPKITIEQDNNIVILNGKDEFEILDPNELDVDFYITKKYIIKKNAKKNNKENFETKIKNFKDKLKKKYPLPNSKYMSIDRNNLLNSSIKEIKKISLKDQIKINFKGEECIDAGGIMREYLTVLFKEILDPKTDLFEKTENDEISYIFSQNQITDTKKNYYEFIGTIIARALTQGLTVNCLLNSIIYKLILQEEIKLNDLIFIDRQLYLSLKNLIDLSKTQNIEDLEMYFEIDTKINGKMKHINLINNGNKIKVTNNNLYDFIAARINYLINSQLEGISYIIKGIEKVFPLSFFDDFSSDELNLLINGFPFIDIEEWKENTEYVGYAENEQLIKNFWEILYTFSQDDLSKLLQFVTGCSRVPIGGFKSLESNKGSLYKFTIQKIDYNKNKMNFCRAHTCFNKIDIPNFPNKVELLNAIKFAIENECLGFGMS